MRIGSWRPRSGRPVCFRQFDGLPTSDKVLHQTLLPAYHKMRPPRTCIPTEQQGQRCPIGKAHKPVNKYSLWQLSPCSRKMDHLAGGIPCLLPSHTCSVLPTGSCRPKGGGTQSEAGSWEPQSSLASAKQQSVSSTVSHLGAAPTPLPPRPPPPVLRLDSSRTNPPPLPATFLPRQEVGSWWLL